MTIEKIKLNIGENDLKKFLCKNLKIYSLEFLENNTHGTHFYLCFNKKIENSTFPMIIHFSKDNVSY
jgi:hypothetical protein